MIQSEITVGIGQCTHASHDGGRSWNRSLRELPDRHSPLVRGNVDRSSLPSQGDGELWDSVSILSCGFGAAVSHRLAADRKFAQIFVTEDGGLTWEPRRPEPKVPLLRLPWNGPSWPAERFDSLVVPKPRHVALAWEDPWIFDGSQSHVIHSHNGGQTWGYECLGDANPYLALDHAGKLLSLNDGFYLVSPDGGRTWAKRTFSIEWPTGHRGKRVAMLRHVTFTGPHAGYALVVHWPGDQAGEISPEVGLVTSADGGDSWGHLRVFASPSQADVNERHVLDLKVEPLQSWSDTQGN